MIDIKGLDKAEVLYALYHNSHAQGMSFLGLPHGKENFTLEHAREIIKETGYVLEGEYHPGRLYFDYLEGHIIKCDITNDEFDERLYDRDCGEGAAAKAVAYVREGKLNEIDIVPCEFELLRELLKPRK
jgi:hypothetical protein